MTRELVIVLSPGQKAQKTARWARIMTKWLITYSRRYGAKWRFVEFGGLTGAESYGIVDILAIRKDHKTKKEGVKRGDLFDLVLIQTKGGSARSPSESDIVRLIKAADHHRAKAVVLAEWKLGTKPKLYKLVNQTWQLTNPVDIFG
jgi:hypothetical protein